MRQTLTITIPRLRTNPVEWKLGEHVAVIGTNGTGKTYLMSVLADMRRYVVVVKTKADDIKFINFIKDRRGTHLNTLYADKILLDPPFHRQSSIIRKALFDIWETGNWNVFLDELYYIDRLGLRGLTDMLLTQGRSKKISVITGMQRPVWITRFALSECTHIFCFRLEGRDLKTISDITNDDFAEVVASLDRSKHEFAHFHVPSATIAKGNANSLERILYIPHE